jgi:O-acetyl-ADP-ribose deacetylase (regulator of RNase III)
LMKAHQRNGHWLRRLLLKKNCESIIVPIMGAGDAGLPVIEVVPKLITVAINYLQNDPSTTLKEVYFLAYTAGHKSACDRELKRYCRAKVISLVE